MENSMHVGGASKLPETVTAMEQAQAAGQKIRRTGELDDFDVLKEQINSVIERYAQGMPQQHLGMARARAEELIFWLRSGSQRRHQG